MDKELQITIETFNKADKEYSTAYRKYEELKKEYIDARQEAHDAINNLGAKKYMEEYRESVNAKEAAMVDARKAMNIANVVRLAASMNTAKAGANALKKAISENPKAFDYPAHYKKYKEAVKNVLGDRLDTTDGYINYVCFYDGVHGHNEAMMENLEKEYKIFTLAELKKEAKKAASIAEKIKKKYDALEQESKAMRDTLESYTKWLLPSIEYHGYKDEYNLFD